jgi:hypothetical protein
MGAAPLSSGFDKTLFALRRSSRVAHCELREQQALRHFRVVRAAASSRPSASGREPMRVGAYDALLTPLPIKQSSSVAASTQSGKLRFRGAFFYLHRRETTHEPFGGIPMTVLVSAWNRE